MTVSELIEQLQQFPAGEVLVPSYEDGFDPVTDCRRISVQQSGTKEWYYGLYDEKENGAQVVLIASKYTRAEKEVEDD